MIIANITSFIGQCADAVHYYCTFEEFPDTIPILDIHNVYIPTSNDLIRVLAKESEVIAHNKKAGGRDWHIGKQTNSFNTFSEIHRELKKQCKGKIIVTYYEEKAFKEMLYFKDGKNLGFKYFKEVWIDMPNACYKHLLPPYDKIKVKCNDCGKVYKFEDIIREEREWEDGKIQVMFREQRHMKNTCCEYPIFKWNVIL